MKRAVLMGMAIGTLLAVPAAQASEQGLFFALHQATFLVERMTQGACRKDAAAVEKLLISADKELAAVIASAPTKRVPATPLEAELQALWRFHQAKFATPIHVLEAFRLNLHEKAARLGLKHDDAWHRQPCPQSRP